MDFSRFTDNQAECVKLLDGPLLVCAGAGSGKTFMLTQRVAWALEEGSGRDGRPFMESVDQALIITYTNKAAGELKDRIRSTLRAEGMIPESLKVDGAWISTIHGMCDRILHEHALELGIDPDFRLIMNSDAKDVQLEAINLVFRDADNEELLRDCEALFGEYGAKDVASMLAKVLDEASSLTDGIDAFDIGPAPANPKAMARHLIEELDAVKDVLTPKNREKSETVLAALNAFTTDPAADVQELADVLGGAGFAKQASKPEVCDAIDLVRQSAAELSLASAHPFAQALLNLARAVDAEYKNLLRERGLMDIGELIRTTLRAFRENPEIAASYTDRFKLIMVDEFQDTSQLQIDMIECVAGTAKRHLCTVGDSQQSIYRFQGADVNVYLEHKHDMQSAAVGAKTIEMKDNFRSHGDILAYVRKVCDQKDFFIEDFLDLQHARDEQRVIAAGSEYRGKTPRIETFLATYPFRCETLAVQTEAEHIADRFAELRDAGHRADQMVILLGVMTHAAIFAEALRERGFACVITGGSGFFKTEEVELCQLMLQALDNPLDSQSLLAVLASELLPVSSDDLLRLATHLDEKSQVPAKQKLGLGLYDRSRTPEERSPLLDHALSVFDRAWRKLGRVRPSRIFLDAVTDAGWLQRLQNGDAQDQAKAANVLKFARLMEDAESQVGFDMTRVCVRMAASFENEKEKPGALSVEGGDAVRLMTVHASKGLEFPIVAVADCWKVKAKAPDGTKAGSPLIMTVDGGREYVSLDRKVVAALPACDRPVTAIDPHASQIDYRAQLRQLNYDREYLERRRLLYVAITRASEALIVSTRRQVNLASKELLSDLASGLFPDEPDFPAESRSVDYGGSEPMTFTRVDTAPKEQEPDDAPEADGGPLVYPIPRLLTEPNMRFSPLSSGSDFFSYSSIAPHDSHGPVVADASPLPLGDPDEDDVGAAFASDADKATEFGSALHRACEWLALQTSPPVKNEALERIAHAYGIKDSQRLAGAFERWCESDVCARALGFSSHQPEVPFCAVVGGEYLEGEIDLLCHGDAPDGHAFIVDYKTGGSDAETPEALQEKHLLQAQCYAFATLLSGFESVELHFVRVERSDPHHSDQPQTVDYSFDSSDLESLEARIASARIAAAKSRV